MQQAAALLFQLFVGHPQLFLLGLQLLALALGLFQQLHQLRIEQRRPQGDADRLGALQQQRHFQAARGRHTGTAQLDHADHHAIGRDRPQQALVNGGAAQWGIDIQRAVTVLQATRAAFADDLAPLPGMCRQSLGQLRRQRGAADQHQPLALQAVHRADIGIELRAQGAHGLVSQLARGGIALQAGADHVLAGLQPQRIGRFTARTDGLHHGQRHHQERDATDAAIDEGKRRIAARRRHVVAHRKQDARADRHQQRHFHATLEQRDSDCHEVGQPDRIAQRHHHLRAQRGGHQGGRRKPDPTVTGGRRRIHAVFQLKRGLMVPEAVNGC